MEHITSAIAPAWNSSAGLLTCPSCGDTYGVHVEQVRVSARVEDGVFDEIIVDARSGQVSTHNPEEGPRGHAVGVGRRHRISLMGYCELCPGSCFSLVFTQHKGETFVEWGVESE